MEGKLPTVVTIGGRRYVKNNLNKGSVGGKMRLKEALKSFGKRVQKSTVSHCTIESDGKFRIYELDDSKVILDKNNKPIGFVLTGKSEEIDESKYRKQIDKVADIVGGSGEPGAKEDEDTAAKAEPLSVD